MTTRQAFCAVCGRCRELDEARAGPIDVAAAVAAALRVTCPKVDEGGECDVQIREHPSGVQIREHAGERREQAA